MHTFFTIVILYLLIANIAVIIQSINLKEINMKQWLKEFIHNCVVHPSMMFMPTKWAHKLHDKNADWAFSPDRCDEIGIEQSIKHDTFNKD